MPNYPSNFDRYLSCFSPAHCHLVPAPQGKPIAFADGDQPTCGIEPVSREGVQSIAMYPVDGDFIIFAFKDYEEAKTFAHRVGQKYPLGAPPVTTVQPDRIGYLRELVDLAYAAWSLKTNEKYFVDAERRLAKMDKGNKDYPRLLDSVEHSRKNRTKLAAKLAAAKERDRNMARMAVEVSHGSTPSERSIFEAARNLGYTL